MLLADSLRELHPDKIPGVLDSYVREGRGPEVRQAIPQLQRQHPQLREKFTTVLESLKGTEPALDMIAGSNGVAITCANCGGSVSKQSPDAAAVICQYCGCNAEQVQPDGLSRWKGKIDTQAKFSIGSFFNFRGKKWQAVGVQKYSGRVKEWDSEDKRWDTSYSRYTLWWMLNEQRELAWLSDYGNKRYWSSRYVPKKPGLPEEKNRRTEYGDWQLNFAAGEFSYHPVPGQKRKTYEVTRPPSGEDSRDSNGDRYAYSTETALDEKGKVSEIEFFRSVTISNTDILRGLGSQELLSAVRRWRITGGLLAGAGALSLVSSFVLKGSLESDQILSKQLTFQDAGEQSLGQIRIEDTPALLRFNSRLTSKLKANRYAEFEVGLSDSENQYVGGYYVEFWHETGYDDGPWRESVYRINRDLRIDEPGTYNLAGLMGATNANFPFDVKLDVSTNPVTTQPFFFSFFAGIASAIISFARSKSLAASGSSIGGRMAETKQRRRKSKRGKPDRQKGRQDESKRRDRKKAAKAEKAKENSKLNAGQTKAHKK